MKNIEVLNVKRRNISDKIQSNRICYKLLKNGQELLYYASSNKLYNVPCSESSDKQFRQIESIDENINYIKILEDRIVISTDHDVVVLDMNEKVLSRIQYTERIRAISVLESKSLVVVVSENLNLQFIDLNESDIENNGVSKQVNIADLKVTLESIGWGSSDKQFQGKKTFPSKNRKDKTQSEVSELIDPNPDREAQKDSISTNSKAESTINNSDLGKASEILNISLENDKYKIGIAWHEDGTQVIVNYAENDARVIKTINRDTLTAVNEGRDLKIFPQIAYNSITDTILVLTVDSKDSFRLMFLEDNGEIKSHMDPNLYDLNEVQQLYFDNHLNILFIKYTDSMKNSFINLYLTCGSNYYLSYRITNPDLLRWELNKYENTSNLFNFIVFDKKCDLIDYTMKLGYIRSPVLFTNLVVKHSKVDIYRFFKDLPPFEYPSGSVLMPYPIRKAVFHPKLPIFALIDESNNLRICEQIKCDQDSRYSPVQIKTLADYSFILEDNIFLTAAWTEKNSLTIYSYSKGNISSKSPSGFNILFEVIPNNSITNNRIDTNTFDQVQIVNENQFESYSESILESDSGALTYAKLLLNNDLFLNGKLVSKNVSSYMIYKSYLFFTTSTQELTYVRISDVQAVGKHVKRPIEAGTLLVGLDGTSGRMIVLMPRGNLETATNMYYTFDYLRELAAKGDFVTIAEIIRVERLDANVLVEVDPDSFIKAKDQYVDFIKRSNSFINCIIDLGFDDILNKTYSNYLNFTATPICKRKVLIDILSILENLDVSYLALRAFLLFKLGKTTECFKCISKALAAEAPDVAERTVKALSTVSSAEELRRYAYSTYDPNMVDFMYKATNADPVRDRIDVNSMYEARKSDPYRFRFDCCMKSRNFEAALSYLIRSSAAMSEEIIQLAQKHNFLNKAYEQAKFTKFRADVGAAYARRLSQQGDHKSAARIYSSEQMFDEAILEYANDGNYIMVNNLAHRTALDNSEGKTRLFQTCITALIARKKATDAAFVAANYLQNSDQAVEILCAHNLFLQAKQFAFAYGDRYTAQIDDQMRFLQRHYYLKMQYLNVELRSAFTRLLEVRAAKLRLLFAPGVGEENYAGEDDGASTVYAPSSSYASSASTQRTKATSAKSQRKENLKKIALKKGGFYEDIALIRYIYKNIELLNDDFKTAVTIFEDPDLECGNYIIALKIKAKIVYDWLKTVIPVIWLSKPQVEEQRLSQEYEAAVINFQHLDEQFRTPPSIAENYAKTSEISEEKPF